MPQSDEYYFKVVPVSADGGTFNDMQIAHQLNLLGQEGMPDVSTYMSASDAFRACCKALLGIGHAQGALGLAQAYRVRVFSERAHEVVEEHIIYRGELVCPSCGARAASLRPARRNEVDAPAGFEFDRKHNCVVYAERVYVYEVECLEEDCRYVGDVDQFVIGVDMTAAKLGIRFVSVREEF